MNKTVVLIDGMGILYRMYYAIQGLSTKSGRPTNAVYGFIRAIKQIENIWRPSHWAVAFDGGMPEYRLSLLRLYKAQRPPTPDGLREQIPIVEDYLSRAGITWLRLPNEEADDVLATLIAKIRREADMICLATSDKDMYQLVDDKVRVVSVSGGAADAMGCREVKAKTGVMPAQIADWLAMVGDSADNIPGVPGVGPKTAAKLLNAYGSLDELLGKVKNVENEKLRKKLMENEALMRRNLKLVRLRDDLDCDFSWEGCKCRPVDAARVAPLLRELEFNSMANELGQIELFREH